MLLVANLGEGLAVGDKIDKVRDSSVDCMQKVEFILLWRQEEQQINRFSSSV